MKRVPGVIVTPCVPIAIECHSQMSNGTASSYYGKIQDKDEDYYMQFNVIICGLDSVEARRWMNATLVNMFDPENMDSLKPMIDGGTEGARLF